MFDKEKSMSSVYGYYGGVKNDRQYVPPESTSFVPQPAMVPNPFNLSAGINAEQLRAVVEFVNTNANDILLRKNTSSLPNNIDTFVMTTSGNPEDVIIYQSDQDVVTLGAEENIGVVGGTPDEDDVIDAGFF